MKKDKKILLGILIGISFFLVLAKDVKAECVEKVEIPECSGTDCSGYDSSTTCATNSCCYWKEEAPSPCQPAENPPSWCFGEKRCADRTQDECTAPCCQWVGGMVEQRGCLQEICESCEKGSIFEKWLCYIKCIFVYFLSLPFRIGWAIVGILVQLIVFVVFWLAFNLIPPILNQLINASLQWPPASVNKLEKAWAVIRDFSLSLVFIFILVIGVATIFRLAEYEARKALVPLIIAALLINFSFAISTKIIDWANKITIAIRNSLAEPSGTTGEDFLGSKTIFKRLSNQLTEGTTLMIKNIFCLDGDIRAYFTTVKAKTGEYKGPILPMMGLFLLYPVIVASIAGFILGSYIRFAMVLIMRTVFFVALVLVSPIAFLSAAISRRKEVSHIFPGFLNWTEWWNTFLQWSFCGIALVIWLAVAGMILQWGNELFNITPRDFDTIGKEIVGMYATSTNPTRVQNQIADPLQDLIRAFLPILGAGTAIFFGARSAPKMGEEFAKAALGLVSGVITAVVTGATLATAAALPAAGAVLAGAAARATQPLGQMTAALSRRQWRTAGREALRAAGYLGGGVVAAVGTMARIGGRYALRRAVPLVKEVIPAPVKEVVEEVKKLPILSLIRSAPWGEEVARVITQIREGGRGAYNRMMTRLLNTRPELAVFLLATPAEDIRRELAINTIAARTGVPEEVIREEHRRYIRAIRRRTARPHIPLIP